MRRYAFPFALLVVALLAAHAIHLPSAFGWHEDTRPSLFHGPTSDQSEAAHRAGDSASAESPVSASMAAAHVLWCVIQAVTHQTQVSLTLAVLGSLLPLLAIAQAGSGPIGSAPAWHAPPRQRRALIQVFHF